MNGSKSLELLSLLPRRPVEFSDRLATLFEIRLEQFRGSSPAYPECQWDAVVHELGASLGVVMEDFLNEPALLDIDSEVRQGIDQLSHEAPFRLAHNADPSLARMCYLLCRARRPAVVLETGVAYGVTTAYILRALEVNAFGTLHSVDLPPLGRNADRFVGSLIPEGLKHRWHYHRGSSKRLLRRILPELRRVDIFIHDSLHTHRNMRREFQVVTPYLSDRAIVIADDVDGNAAFSEWAQVHSSLSATVRETGKSSLFGVGLARSARPARP